MLEMLGEIVKAKVVKAQNQTCPLYVHDLCLLRTETTPIRLKYLDDDTTKRIYKDV